MAPNTPSQCTCIVVYCRICHMHNFWFVDVHWADHLNNAHYRMTQHVFNTLQRTRLWLPLIACYIDFSPRLLSCSFFFSYCYVTCWFSHYFLSWWQWWWEQIEGMNRPSGDWGSNHFPFYKIVKKKLKKLLAVETVCARTKSEENYICSVCVSIVELSLISCSRVSVCLWYSAHEVLLLPNS